MFLVPTCYTWFFPRVIIILILEIGNIDRVFCLLLSIHKVSSYNLKTF